jgi:hypothetical protein
LFLRQGGDAPAATPNIVYDIFSYAFDPLDDPNQTIRRLRGRVIL